MRRGAPLPLQRRKVQDIRAVICPKLECLFSLLGRFSSQIGANGAIRGPFGGALGATRFWRTAFPELGARGNGASARERGVPKGERGHAVAARLGEERRRMDTTRRAALQNGATAEPRAFGERSFSIDHVAPRARNQRDIFSSRVRDTAVEGAAYSRRIDAGYWSAAPGSANHCASGSRTRVTSAPPSRRTR